MNFYDDVGKFHRKFDLPVAQETADKLVMQRITNVTQPRLMTPMELDYRLKFIWEELREFIEAHAKGDLVGAADAVADLAWVVLGMGQYMGLPFEAVWAEVRRANMEKRPWKEGDKVKPRNTVGMEVVKPEGWQPPDILRVISEALDNAGVQGV